MGKRSHENALLDPMDLYETPAKATQSIIDTVISKLPNHKDLILYDCCCGNNAIVNVLINNGYKAIGTDKYTQEVSIDALIDLLPEHDIIITNPPFNVSTAFVKKFYETGKPFLMILPINNLSRKNKHILFQQYGVIVYTIFPLPKYLHKGKDVQADETAWFYGNSGEVGEGEIIVKYCGKLYS